MFKDTLSYTNEAGNGNTPDLSVLPVPAFITLKLLCIFFFLAELCLNSFVFFSARNNLAYSQTNGCDNVQSC